MATILERIGKWASELSIWDIPPKTRDRIRLQIATALSAAAASPWYKPALTVLKTRKTKGKSMVYATCDRVAGPDAAFINSAFAMALDYDDYMLSGHTGHSAVFVPLAHAETIGQVIVAAAAANEFMGRLSTACLLGPVNGQMSSYIHNAGAAIAMAKIMGLPPKKFSSAIALSLYQPNFCLTPGFWHQDAKTVTASQPLAQGIQAALLAEAGLNGPMDILEHPLGFLSFFSFGKFSGLFDGLGTVWFSDTLCYKRYPGTSYISAAVEAALECSGGRPLSPDDIKHITIETTILSSTLDSIGAAAIDRDPLDANAINFSVRLSVATALLFGDLAPGLLHPDMLARAQEDIRAIAKKITVVHDWEQTLRMMSSSPVGLTMLKSLPLPGIIRSIYHARRMNRASGRLGRNKRRIIGLLLHTPRLAGLLRGTLQGSVSADEFNPEKFRMLQSAKVTLKSKYDLHTAMIEVPMGACGRDEKETSRLVKRRCEQVFGKRADRLWTILFDENATVTALESCLASYKQKNPLLNMTKGGSII